MFTNEEKLNVLQRVLITKIMSISTLLEFRNFIKNITKQKLVNFLKQKLDEESISLRDSATSSNETADDQDDLQTELNEV